MTHARSAASRLHELGAGWRVLLASACGVCFGMSGLTIFSFGVFILPLSREFGWTRAQISLASSFLIVANAITAPLVGAAIDRYGARRIAVGSMLCLAVGYALLSRASGNLMLFYAVWLALALAGGGTTNVVWTRAINLSFDRTRGMALGLILAGSGTAAIFAPILCARAIEAAGWRGGYLAIAVAILCIPVPATLALFREPQPAANRGSAPVPVASGRSLAESLRSTTYWKLAAAFFLVSLGVSFIIVHLVPMLTERGMTEIEAAGTASFLGIAIVVGRLSDGVLVDRFHAPLIGTILFAVSALGCLLLASGGHDGLRAVAAVIAFGLAGGAEVHLLAFLTSRYFGMRAYGQIYGCQLMTFYAAAALGPLLAGIGYDLFQGYRPVLLAAVGTLSASALVLTTLGAYPRFEAAAAETG
jgi:predicted MFS family arabinose efflux permease